MEDIPTQMRPTMGDNITQQFMVPTMIAPGKRTSTIAKPDEEVARFLLFSNDKNHN
jgi:alpha-L-rhamnosidase